MRCFKITALLICLILCVSSVTAVTAEQEWTKSEINGTAVFNADNTEVAIECKTTRRDTASVLVSSPVIADLSAGGKVARIAFVMTASGFDLSGTSASVMLGDKTANRAELLKIASGGTLTAAGSADTAMQISYDTQYRVEVIADTQGDLSISINDETVYKGTDNAELSALEPNELCFYAQNMFSTRTTGSSMLTLSNMSFSTEDAFEFAGLNIGGKLNPTMISTEAINAEKIKIAFSGMFGAEMASKENYSLLINSEAAEFDFNVLNDGVLISPKKSLAIGDSIKITISKIADCFGFEPDAEKEYYISVIGDDYAAPTISINYEGSTSFIYGGSVGLPISADSAYLNKISVYVNETLVGDYSQNSFIYTFKPDAAGSYTIKAVAEDIYGAAAEEQIMFTVAANEAPRVSFEDYANGAEATFLYEDKKLVRVLGSDDSGIAKIEIYVNGNLRREINESSAVIDLDDFGLGMGTTKLEAIAFDTSGLTAKTTLYVVIVRQAFNDLINEKNFKESANKFESGISVARQRGFARVEKVDEAHGNSLIIGMDENCDTEKFSNTQYTYVQHSFYPDYKSRIYEFDVRMQKAPIKNGGVVLCIRRSNGTFDSLFSIGNTGFVLRGVTVPVDEGEWYHVSFPSNYSGTTMTFDIVVTDSKENIIYKVENLTTDLGVNPSGYRIYTTTDPANFCEIAFDNITLTSIEQSFTVLGVGNEDGGYSDKIAGGTDEVSVYISGKLVSDDATPDKISLYRGSRKVEIRSVRYNSETGCVTLKLTEPLRADAGYRVVFDGSVGFGNGGTLGAPMEYDFTTVEGEIDVVGVTRKPTKDGLEITVSISNKTEKDMPICVFVSVFDKDERIVGTQVFEDIAVADMYGAEHTYSCRSGAYTQVFVCDAINIGHIYYSDYSGK